MKKGGFQCSPLGLKAWPQVVNKASGRGTPGTHPGGTGGGRCIVGVQGWERPRPGGGAGVLHTWSWPGAQGSCITVRDEEGVRSHGRGSATVHPEGGAAWWSDTGVRPAAKAQGPPRCRLSVPLNPIPQPGHSSSRRSGRCGERHLSLWTAGSAVESHWVCDCLAASQTLLNQKHFSQTPELNTKHIS